MEEVIKFIGGATVLIAAVAWLIRTLAKHILSKDIEIFKSQLLAKSNIELEKLKHELKLISSEHEKRMQILHERRAGVIAELYSKLLDFIGAAELYTGDPDKFDETSKETRASNFTEKASVFNKFYNVNRIYFNKSICNQVDFLIIEVISKIINVQIRFTAINNTSGLKKYDMYQESWDKAIELVHEKVPLLKEAIEDEFRNLIGVSLK